MGLPRKLKNLNLYVDGGSYLGEIGQFEEPALAIATEEWRGGGMVGPVQVDNGLQAMEATITMGGHVKELIRKFGTTDVAGVRLRLVSAFQRDDGTPPEAVEVYIGGRFSEIGFGTSAAGEDTEHEYTVPLAYYRRVVDGRTEIEIDMVAGRFLVDGVDRYAEIMAILNG